MKKMMKKQGIDLKLLPIGITYVTDWFKNLYLKSVIDKWYRASKHKLNVVVFGKTGVGKSTLLNSLFEQEIFETGEMEATTKEIYKSTHSINNVPIVFYDVPGLFDDENNDDIYLEKIEQIMPKWTLYYFVGMHRIYDLDEKILNYWKYSKVLLMKQSGTKQSLLIHLPIRLKNRN